ncbi:hypothetical protein HK104_007579, partial [Borealophlyctis nickersoniae]
QLDITDTRLVDCDDVNVVLRDDGIFIKKTNKTHEPNVLLEFKDERLKNAVKTLVDIRKKQGKDRLLLLKDGGIPVDVKKWFGDAFKEEHDGSLASEKIIEDMMGHSWSTHQKHYNLTRLENGEAVGESEDEDEDEVVAGDALNEEAGDALARVN